MFEGLIVSKIADKYFEKSVFKIIKRRAAIGALLMMIPDFGLGGFIFIAVLWNMYTKIAQKVGVSFAAHRGKLIGIGAVINIIVAFILDFALSAVFFIEPFIVYARSTCQEKCL